MARVRQTGSKLPHQVISVARGRFCPTVTVQFRTDVVGHGEHTTFRWECDHLRCHFGRSTKAEVAIVFRFILSEKMTDAHSSENVGVTAKS